MNPSKFVPPAWSAVLYRERLMHRLAAWEDRKLVLIHGPAGQGKSTLAAEYVRGLEAPSVWYTLDGNDDDPAVLLSGLVQAVLRAHPLSPSAFPDLPRPRYGADPPAQAFTRWQEGLLAALPDGLIVFDDYPADEGSPAFRQVISALVRGTRPGVRIMIISRSRPSFDEGALRAKRLVGEIGGDDLRFSGGETASLFGSVFGMQVAAPDAAILSRVTEGWAAGLVLLHEYLAALPPDQRSATFPGPGGSGFHGQVFDYLAQEVFTRLPAEIQDFLCRTSIADHLPLPLLATLSGLPETGEDGALTVRGMVRELRRRNLFVSTTDPGGTTIRYHGLFRDFLRKRAATRLKPAQLRRLHHAASSYFAHAGDPVRSIELLIASGQQDRALALLERTGAGLLAAGQARTLLRLIDGLPAQLGERSWPLFFRAVACRFSDSQAALALFRRAHAGFRAARDIEGQALSLSGIVEASFHSGGDFRRMERAAALARTVLRSGRRLSRVGRARLLLAFGTASFFTGDLKEGMTALREAMKLFHALGDRFHEISAAIYLAPCALYAGDFRLAREAVEKGFEARRAVGEEPGGEAALHLVKAMTWLFAGDFSAAQSSADACRRLSRDHGLESLDLLLQVIGGWIKMAQGDYHGAESLLESCRGRGTAAKSSFFSLSSSHILAIVLLFRNRLEKAKKASDRALSARSGSSRLFRGIYLIVSGAINLELGRPARAGADLRNALLLLRQCGAAQQEANAHLMLARRALRTGDARSVLRRLREGFSIGRELGITYYAPLMPEQLRELAALARENGICADYCGALLAGLRPSEPALRIFCFGGFRVERGGVPVAEKEWKSRRAKSLLKLLAAGGEQRTSRDAAVDALWPAGGARDRTASFGSLLHRARRAVDPPGRTARKGSCIVMEGDRLSLNAELVWTDVAAFLDAIGRARKARAGSRTADALAAYEEAIELCAGDLLPGDPYDQWTIAPREQMRLLFTEAVSHAAEAREALGDRSRSLVLYERMFTFDPCHDKACRWLMQRHAAEGERNKAVRIYERHELAVRKELDMEPDERTRRLYRNIIGG